MTEDYEETPEADEDELCRDIQMKLPDCLWQLDYVNRYRAGKFNEDFAALETGEKFLFGVIEIPFTEEDGSFTWGVWAEVDAGDHDAYVRHFQTDAAEGRVIAGRLANDMPGTPEAFGANVELTLHAGRRPEIRVLEGELGIQQARGMSLSEHEALDRELFGDDDEEGDNEAEA